MLAPRATCRSWRGVRCAMSSGGVYLPPMALHGSAPRPHSTRRRHRYCPACAAELVDREVEGRALPACPACDFIAFRDPKVVAVTALVEDGAAWLLRRGIEPRLGEWALPGGY